MTTASNSRTPSLAEVIRAAMDGRLADVHVAIPGKIERYDPATQRADVKPLVKRRVAAADGEEIVESIPVVPSVPVLFPRSGAFFISLPLQVGDNVLLVFCDRSLDEFVFGPPGVEAEPDDFRTHDLSDAIAIPGVWPVARALTGAHPSNLAMGHDVPGGVQLHVDTSAVHLGAYPAADFVALASLVLGELNDLKTAINSWTPVPGDGGAALKTIFTTLFMTWPASVAAARAKAT
jgi:hypothetical protein